MRTMQYCYFALKSTALSAADITDRLLMAPDEVKVMGSKLAEAPLPRCHSWQIVRRSVESVDGQIEHIVNRLRPAQARIAELVADAEVSAVMQVVRYFGHPESVDEAPDGSPWAPGEPRPLGWHLRPSVLEFLVSTGAGLDVDEYDFREDG